MSERQAAGIVFGSWNACTRLEAEILAFGKFTLIPRRRTGSDARARGPHVTHTVFSNIWFRGAFLAEKRQLSRYVCGCQPGRTLITYEPRVRFPFGAAAVPGTPRPVETISVPLRARRAVEYTGPAGCRKPRRETLSAQREDTRDLRWGPDRPG